MNYRTILNDYLPIEQGDFMLRYKINGRGYVLFSPKKDVVSCIELYNFSEISPMQLALLLTFQPKDEQDEFSFSAYCTKEQIIDYLFDVEESQGCAKIRHTSGLQGYLLYDLAKADKVRNLFQFDLEKKESRLLFDSRNCAASLHGDCQGSVIHLCWNPCVFHSIEKGGEPDAPAYLLASSSPVVCGYVLKQIEKCFSSVEKERRIIGIHVGDEVSEAFDFICYYVRNVQDDYAVIVERKDGMVILEMLQWNPIRLANFVATLNKTVSEQIKKCYPDMDACDIRPFACLSFVRKSFVSLPDVKMYQEVFLKSYLGVVKLNELLLLG